MRKIHEISNAISWLRLETARLENDQWSLDNVEGMRNKIKRYKRRVKTLEEVLENYDEFQWLIDENSNPDSIKA
jgi:coenzyme F420-reducing hydrogenase delta subunit